MHVVLVYLDVLIVCAHMFYEQREGAEICGLSFVLSEILRSQKLHLHVLLLGGRVCICEAKQI